MSRRAFQRLGTVLFAVLCLLHSQLAMAAYVCPQAGEAAAMAGMAADEPCTGMDAVQPQLCQQRCAGAAQYVEAVKLPAASLPIILQVVVRPLAPDAVGGAVLVPARQPELRPPPDPLFLSTLRLRV
jgi:hypothetical protein